MHRIGDTVSHYRILEEIGQGGMGVVYRAEDANLKRAVALKFLPPELSTDAEARERFVQEAQAASALQHNNICTIHAIDRTPDGQMFIVMDVYDGETLKQKLDRGPLPPREAADIAIQLGQGLGRAHDRGIVHRDIKPANIFVTRDGTVKILDFGLAKLGAGGMLTRVGTTLGTVAYMSPEQARGDDVDHRTDIWSMGVILYQMLVGRLPFAADHEQAIIYMIQNSDPRPDPAVPGAVWPAVSRALQKDPSARYQQVREFISDLSALSGGDGDGSSRRPAARPAAPARRFPKAGVVAGAAAAIVLVIGGYLLLGPARDAGGTESLPRLAVLPFTNLRSDPETDFLGFALADQIIGELAYVRTLIVRPASAIRKYQNQAVEPPVAGRDLNATLILTGNYLKQANTIRLSLELVDIQTNAIVWRDALEEEYENVFKLQDTVARKVVDGLRIHFSPDELRQMRADVPRNPLAYEYYLKGISYTVTLEGNRNAIAMIRSSIALDSMFAPAYAELAYRLHQIAVYEPSETALAREAETAALRAISLNDQTISAYASLISLYTELGRTEEAFTVARRLLSINPNSPEGHFYLGYVYRYVGFLQLAKKEMETALALDPGHRRFRSIGVTYFYLGDYDRALRGFDLDSASSFSFAWKALVYALSEDRERAMACIDRVVRSEPRSAFGVICAALKLYLERRHDLFKESLRSAELMNVIDGENWYNTAQLYGLANDASGAARTLARAIDAGFFNYPLMLVDPLFSGVRDSPEFKRVLATARKKYDAFKERYPELRDAS